MGTVFVVAHVVATEPAFVVQSPVRAGMAAELTDPNEGFALAPFETSGSPVVELGAMADTTPVPLPDRTLYCGMFARPVPPDATGTGVVNDVLAAVNVPRTVASWNVGDGYVWA